MTTLIRFQLLIFLLVFGHQHLFAQCCRNDKNSECCSTTVSLNKDGSTNITPVNDFANEPISRRTAKTKYKDWSGGSSIPSIHPIEKSKNHYAAFQALDDSKRDTYAWMDTIVYPPNLYKSSSLRMSLAQPVYLTSSQVNYLVNAVQFPANSSEQTRAELDHLLELQENRTEQQEKKVLALAEIGYWPDANIVSTHQYYKKNLENLFFECQEVMGEDCTAEKYPNTSKLLQGVMNDMRLMEFAVKYHLLRARPYQLEPKLEPLTTISSPSFASGHTLWAYIQAYTLGELLPDKREEFVELAYEIGESREILGVHYPSDEEAARQLAHRMLMLMWHTEKFQQDFTMAKGEWLGMKIYNKLPNSLDIKVMGQYQAGEYFEY